jgi:hypothetical protein
MKNEENRATDGWVRASMVRKSTCPLDEQYSKAEIEERAKHGNSEKLVTFGSENSRSEFFLIRRYMLQSLTV